MGQPSAAPDGTMDVLGRSAEHVPFIIHSRFFFNNPVGNIQNNESFLTVFLICVIGGGNG